MAVTYSRYSPPYLSAAPLTCDTEPLASTLTYFFWLPPSLAHSFTSPNAHCPRHWISCITTPSLFQISLFLSLFLSLCCLDRFECPNAECYSGFSPKTVAFFGFPLSLGSSLPVLSLCVLFD